MAILRHRGSRRGRTTDDLRNDNHCARARSTSASDSENCVPARGLWGEGVLEQQLLHNPALGGSCSFQMQACSCGQVSKPHQPVARYFQAVNCEQPLPKPASTSLKSPCRGSCSGRVMI